jgi:hypothetical protein
MVATLTLLAGGFLPATPAGASTGVYVCTSGANLTVKNGAVFIVGQGSCIDQAGEIIPLNYQGASVGGGTVSCILPMVPLVLVPAMNVTLTLAFDQGLHTQVFNQRWSTIRPLGSPLYAATVSGDGAGVVAGLSLSGAIACGFITAIQGPFAEVFVGSPAPPPHHPPT